VVPALAVPVFVTRMHNGSAVGSVGPPDTSFWSGKRQWHGLISTPVGNDGYGRRFLNELAPNFGILGAPLFRPEQDLAAEASDLYATNVPPGSVVVGTHIRCMILQIPTLTLCAGLCLIECRCRLRYSTSS